VDSFGAPFRSIYTSPQISSMLGFTSEEWGDLVTWQGAIHPDDRDRVIAEDERTNRSMEPFNIEYRLITKDGHIMWIRDEARVVTDEFGHPRLWSGVMFDITSLKRAEEELARALDLEREASARLRTLDELKNTFLQAVSHDLRTPLSAVLGGALTLDRDDINLTQEESSDLVHRIAVNAKKLSRLVTDLLDLDRLANGLLEPQRSSVDVGQMVGSLIEESEILAHRGICIEADPGTNRLDPSKVERIVENLLVNAVRHTPPGTSIWVKVRQTGDGVLLVVDDNGPGIPRELRETIFRPFERGPTPSEHDPGTGIGLALVARFAELHGGRAWVEDRPGGGASFNVALPG
jgi:PAS domain S-box-containing protein